MSENRARKRRADSRAAKPAVKRPAKEPSGRRIPSEDRRRAILDAALAIFAEHGFEAARLDDVATRAGVAKGTLYLYFDNKQFLFEALIRDSLVPVLAQLETIASGSVSDPVDALAHMLQVFEKQVLGSDRKLVLRLIIAEGPRFPAIAKFYHREVVSRGLAIIRGLAQRADREGRISGGAIIRYPQLLVAPLLLAVVWDGLFSGIEKLDVGGMLAAHLDLFVTEGGKA